MLSVLLCWLRLSDSLTLQRCDKKSQTDVHTHLNSRSVLLLRLGSAVMLCDVTEDAEG